MFTIVCILETEIAKHKNDIVSVCYVSERDVCGKLPLVASLCLLLLTEYLLTLTQF